MAEAGWLDYTHIPDLFLCVGVKLSGRQARLFGAACCRRLDKAVLAGPAGEAIRACEQYADGELNPEVLAQAWGQALRWTLRSPSVTAAFVCGLAARPEGVAIGMVAGLVASIELGSNGRAIEQSCRDCARAELRTLPGRSPGIGDWLGRVWGGMTDGAAGYDRAKFAQDMENYRRAGKARADLEGQLQDNYKHLTDLLREIGGRPDDCQPFDSERATQTIRSLAQAAYEHRALPSGTLDAARLAVLSDALEEAGYRDEDVLTHLRSPGPHVRGCWALDLVLGKQ